MLSVQQFLSQLSTSENPNNQSSEFQAAFDTWQNTTPLPDATKWAFEKFWYDHNTPNNQDIKRRMIDREGFLCQSALVSATLEKWDNDLFTWDDVVGGENYSVELSSGWWEGNAAERDAKIDELREELDCELSSPDTTREKWEQLENDISLLENADGEREIFEWWACSSWMIKKLKEQGEAILETDFGDWWGRQTTGQAILLDGCISRIAFDMEILECQENDWSKK